MALVFVHQFLEQLLTGTQADEFNTDVHVRLLARQADHLAGQIDHADRLAHVQHVYLAAQGLLGGADGRGLQHQLHRLGDGHEEASDIGVGHRHRSARRDLALKQRIHRAGGAQHITEAHGHETGEAALQVHGLAIGFGPALGGAHDIVRIDRLVGGDQHHGRRAVARAGVGHMLHAQHIGLGAGDEVGLDQGHVLERGGVEHDVRPLCREQALDGGAVAHVGQHIAARQGRADFVQLLADRVEVELAVFEQGQTRGAELGDLTAQFRAD